MSKKQEKPLRPHSKTRNKLRERLMSEQIDHKIEERRESATKEAEPSQK